MKGNKKGGLAIESMGLLVLMIVTIAIILFAFVHYFMKSRSTLDKGSSGVSKNIISVINGISKSVKNEKGYTLIPNTGSTTSTTSGSGSESGSTTSNEPSESPSSSSSTSS